MRHRRSFQNQRRINGEKTPAVADTRREFRVVPVQMPRHQIDPVGTFIAVICSGEHGRHPVVGVQVGVMDVAVAVLQFLIVHAGIH